MKHILLSLLGYSCYLESPTAHYRVPVGAVYMGKNCACCASYTPSQTICWWPLVTCQ